MLLLFWNVKYFGPDSAGYADRIADIVRHIKTHRPIITVLVELTSNADIVLADINKQLGHEYQTKSINVGGGNNEHFGVLLAPVFGLGSAAKLTAKDVRIGGGTRMIGHLSIPKMDDVRAFGLYMCHPSPCAFTNSVALKEAVEFLDGLSGRSLMVGDFNAKDWTIAGAGGAHPDVATHQGASKKLCTIDGAVFRDMQVRVIKVQRVTSAGAKSDHSWILFDVS